MLYALVVAGYSIWRYEEHDTPPPSLATAKGLRWLPVVDTLPTPGAGERLTGPVVTVTDDAVTRVWTAVAIPLEEIKARDSAICVDRVQRQIDATAQGFGYDSIVTAVSYASDPTNPTWQAEGIALRGYRAACWTAAYAYISNANPIDPDECLAALPSLATVAGFDAYRAMILRRADLLATTDPVAALALRATVA